jgi:hypothetical protein
VSGLEQNRRRSVVGRVEDAASVRGWFFGHFAEEPLLRSDLVEVAWQTERNKPRAPEDAHFHRFSVEINLVVQGSLRLTIDGERHSLCRGDFFVVWPETIVADVDVDPDAEIVVVRAPSVRGDKLPAAERP